MSNQSDSAGLVSPVTEKSIYVLCHGGLVTGGAELLHQLVSTLRAGGREAFIVYEPLGQAWPTPQAYERYACPTATAIPDEPDVAVVVPEVSTALLFGFRRARHVIWWLSVDNYKGNSGLPAVYLRRLLVTDIPDVHKATHLFQSAYARDFVQRRFSMAGAMLSDYLAEEYLSGPVAVERKRWVAYNPRKGIGYTRKLIAACPELEFVALEKMNREEIRRTLSSSSVYIDFGAHPGKDRIPREAAMCGAVVIVGKRGSAGTFEDVPLEPDYKLKAAPSSIPRLKQLLGDILADLGRHQERQAPYREEIATEKDLFQRQIEQVFETAPPPASLHD